MFCTKAAGKVATHLYQTFFSLRARVTVFGTNKRGRTRQNR